MTPVLGWERLEREAAGGFCSLFWVLPFFLLSLLPVKILDDSKGDTSCLSHLCVLLIPVIVAQILLWTKSQLSFSLSQRQRIPRGNKHHLHPASCLELRWLCPARPLRAGCVHHLHDCDSSQQCIPSHSSATTLCSWNLQQCYSVVQDLHHGEGLEHKIRPGLQPLLVLQRSNWESLPCFKSQTNCYRSRWWSLPNKPASHAHQLLPLRDGDYNVLLCSH